MIAGHSVGGDLLKGHPRLAWFICVVVAACFGALIALAGGLASAAILLTLAAAGMTLRNYRFGLWFLVLLIPLSAAPVFPRAMMGIPGANPYNALLGLTLVSFLAEHLSKRKMRWRIAYPSLWWAYIAPVTVAVLIGAQHFSEIPSFAFAKELVHFTTIAGYLRDIFVKPLLYIVLALLLGMAVVDGMKSQTIVVALCLAIWLFAAWVGFYVVSSGIGFGTLASATNREALSGTGMHANDLGSMAACMLILMIFAMANADKNTEPRWFYFATAVIAAGLLLMSFSRGAFLAFAVGLAVFFIVQRHPRVVIVALALLICSMPLLPAEIYERLATGINTGGSMVLHSSDDPLTAGRVAGVWKPLWPEVLAHPWLGNGLLAIAWSDPFRSGAMRLATLNPHNLFLKLLLEVGVVGLLLVLFFFFDLWRRWRDAARDRATPQRWLFEGAAAALIGYAAFGFSGGDYLPQTSNFWLWIVLGLLFATPAGHARHLRRGAPSGMVGEVRPPRAIG